MNLEGFTYQLKFLHNLELRVQLNDYTGHTDSEVRHIFASNVVLEFLDTDESGADCVGGAVEGCVTETEFGSIFYHTETVWFNIICAVDWEGLELSPSHR